MSCEVIEPPPADLSDEDTWRYCGSDAPPEPCMSDEEYDELTSVRKAILTCNVIGCRKVVCTYHMLCLYHTLRPPWLEKERLNNLARWADDGGSLDTE